MLFYCQDRSLSPGPLCLHWLGHLPKLASPACFAHSQGLTESYTNISKSVEYTRTNQNNQEKKHYLKANSNNLTLMFRIKKNWKQFNSFKSGLWVHGVVVGKTFLDKQTLVLQIICMCNLQRYNYVDVFFLSLLSSHHHPSRRPYPIRVPLSSWPIDNQRLCSAIG